MTSIIKPDEFDAAISRLDRGIRGVNESLPCLDVKTLIRSGHLGVIDQVEAVIERRIELFDTYFESALSDVTGAVRTLKLSFSVPAWIETTLRSLTCCSPVSLAAAGEAEPQTIVVACGEDLEAVEHTLRRNPRLSLVESVAGTDPRMIVLHRHVEGLSIDSTPTFNDGKRAARSLPQARTGASGLAGAGQPRGMSFVPLSRRGLSPQSGFPRPGHSRTRHERGTPSRCPRTARSSDPAGWTSPPG